MTRLISFVPAFSCAELCSGQSSLSGNLRVSEVQLKHQDTDPFWAERRNDMQRHRATLVVVLIILAAIFLVVGG